MNDDEAPDFPELGSPSVTYEELMAEREGAISSMKTIEQAVNHLKRSERGEAALDMLWEMIDQRAYGFDAVCWQCVIAIAQEFQVGDDPFPRMRDAMDKD